MKKTALYEITLMQFIFIIHGAQFGVGILSLPAQLARSAGTDGWISLLIGWAIALIASVIIIQAMKKNPQDTLYELTRRYFGKVLGGVMNVCIIGYYAFAFLTSFFASAMFMKLQLLPKTPFPIVVLLFLIPTFIITRNQIHVLSRYMELIFWAFAWLLLVYLEPLRRVHWLNLLPVLKEGWQPVLGAVQTTGLSFLGFEIAFIVYPFLKNKQDAIKGVVIGNTLTLVLYLIGTLVCFLFFSPDDIASYRFPPIKVIKTIEFRFLDRVDIILLTAYLFLLSRVWLLYLFSAVFGTSRMVGMQDHKPHLIIVLTGVLLLSIFYFPSDTDNEYFQMLLSKFGSYFAFVFPLFLLVYARLCKPVSKGEIR